MKLGKRIVYDKNTGLILNGYLEERFDSGLKVEMIKQVRPLEIDYLDLPYNYNDNNFKEAINYYIDTTKDKNTTELKDLIVITQYIQKEETEEERLRREKLELENQLLLKENENVGGIL
ncbi:MULTISPECIES: hypothetical protein [unclassified Clostridium]|uniref:hypothetical protein n=1 Tax=unclassified Clostridium TaxID=2614128 RepID=UPI0025B95D79|nr:MULTISPECIES: hypothetical protein [unclassified Clostridium]